MAALRRAPIGSFGDHERSPGLFGYAALHHPEHAADIARVLVVPPKRHRTITITFLTECEADALLTAPDQTAWIGRRDHALLTPAIHTGLRASELTGLTCADLHLGAGPHVSCHGKGRKDRITSLLGATATSLRLDRRTRRHCYRSAVPAPARNTAEP